MNRHFSITTYNDIVIYGFGDRSRTICDSLCSRGCIVKLFIDRNPPTDFFRDTIPVISPEKFKEIQLHDPIYIIGLQDGLKHDEVARCINTEYGADNIVFIPMEMNMSIEDIHKLRMNYNALLNEEFDRLDDIPCYYRKSSNPLTILESERKISFWCPVNSIYTRPIMDIEKALNISRLDKGYDVLLRNSDLKLNAFVPYLSLFDWGVDRTRYPEEYLEIERAFGVTLSDEEILENRWKLIEKFKFALKYDMSFFCDSPSIGYFRDNKVYLSDGAHRACFLVSEGYESVPVSLSVEDYEKYVRFYNVQKGMK